MSAASVDSTSIYYASMVWLAYSIVKDVTNAEDIAQQSFAAACKTLAALKRQESSQAG